MSWVTAMFGAHPSHHWTPDDDNLECGNCMCRPYNDEAKRPCPDEPGHAGPGVTQNGHRRYVGGVTRYVSECDCTPADKQAAEYPDN